MSKFNFFGWASSLVLSKVTQFIHFIPDYLLGQIVPFTLF